MLMILINWIIHGGFQKWGYPSMDQNGWIIYIRDDLIFMDDSWGITIYVNPLTSPYIYIYIHMYMYMYIHTHSPMIVTFREIAFVECVTTHWKMIGLLGVAYITSKESAPDSSVAYGLQGAEMGYCFWGVTEVQMINCYVGMSMYIYIYMYM